MNKILDRLELDQTLAAFRSVFLNPDPFKPCFQPAVEERVLFYPTAGFILDERQFRAVAAAASLLEERHAVVTLTEFLTDTTFLNVDSWRIDLSSWTNYQHLRDKGPILVENAIYSPSGAWGVLVSQEFHAIVGGKKAFITFLQECLPMSVYATDFLQCWKGNAQRIDSDTSWISPLLEHLIGQEQAVKATSEAGLTPE
jgi:hypothetical protein